MKVFISVLVLIFSLQSWCKANNISEFLVEGIGVNESALNFFDKNYIDSKGSSKGYKSKKFKYATLKSDKFEIYDDIQIHYLKDDNEYKIHSISANVDFPNNISNCLKLKSQVNSEIKSLFSKPDETNWGKRVLDNVDSTLETYAYQNIYWLEGGNIILSCRDYGITMENKGHIDYFAIMIDNKFFEEWINNEAHK